MSLKLAITSDILHEPLLVHLSMAAAEKVLEARLKPGHSVWPMFLKHTSISHNTGKLKKYPSIIFKNV